MKDFFPYLIMSIIALIYVAKVFIFLFFFYYIFKKLLEFIMRRNNHNYFKNNVVFQGSPINHNLKPTGKYVYRDVSLENLKEFNIDNINLLKDSFYKLFYKFECAYNDLDFNTMKVLSTKQLFQNYYTGINLDLKVGHKRIIREIKRKAVVIYDIDNKSMGQTVSVMIHISYYNYTLDKYGNVISGDINFPTNEKFEILFKKGFDDQENAYKCPNCGSIVEGAKCEYCRTTIENNEFKIASIKKIIEK